jgi:hypothetical protein
MRKALVAAVVVGAVLVAASVVIRFVAAPWLVKLPSDVNETRVFNGTATTLLNAPALASGSTTNVVLHNVPIVATHATKVLDTNSDSALIADTHALTAAGAPVATSTYNYAVDRKDMARGSGFNNVTKQTGITFNFPIDSQKHDYTGWVSDTGTPTTLKYTGTGKRGGLDVYTYAANVPATPLTDQHQLATLPKALPKAAIPGLAAANGVPPALLASAQPLLDALPAQVPLAYTYQAQATFYVDPQTGVVVDLTQHEVRSAAIAGAQGLPSFPIADLTFTSTPATLNDAVKDANDRGDSITLLESTLPWSFGIAGVILLLVGAIGLPLLNRRRDNETMDGMTTGSEIPTPRVTPTDAPTKTDL